MTPLELLKATRAKLINPANWRKDGVGEDPNSGCLVVTMMRLTDENNGYGTRAAAYDALYEVLPQGYTLDPYGIGYFNDNPNTTHADMIKLLDKAIASVEV